MHKNKRILTAGIALMGLFVFSGGCWAEKTSDDSWIQTAEATSPQVAGDPAPAFPSLNNSEDSKESGKTLKLSTGSSKTSKASGQKKAKGSSKPSKKKSKKKSKSAAQ